jgi:Protein of unknown function (DUF3313)
VRRTRSAATLCLLAVLGACASRPEAKPSGFLSDYSRLEKVDAHRMWYVSPRLAEYDSFIVDPVVFRAPPETLTPEQRAEVAEYFHRRVEDLLKDRGLAVTSAPHEGIARVSFALTDIARSTWWMKIHPGMRASGAGTGGAAMEAEIVDSVTGEQLLAAVQSSFGQQFDITAFSTAADVKSAIDKWAVQAGKRFDEVRAGEGTAAPSRSP